MRVRFALLAEGPSDFSLVDCLQALCIKLGADEAIGYPLDFRGLPADGPRTLLERMRFYAANSPPSEILFVHRDADREGIAPRTTRILATAAKAGLTGRVVPVVPVREMEAWLLLDEAMIRRIARNPGGRAPLGLPSRASIESLADPKRALRRALQTASELRGRHLDRFRKQFSAQRQQLLQALDVHGDVALLPAWVAMEGHLGGIVSP